MIWLGIDPGSTGAVAVLDGDDVEIHDTPFYFDQAKGKTKRRRIDAAGCAALLQDIKADCAMPKADGSTGVHFPDPKKLMVTIEKSQPMPPIRGANDKREDAPIHGSIASFSIGYSFGIWIGILSSLEIPYQLVAPQTWKKLLLSDIGKGKESSLIQARRLWPVQTKESLKRVKDHNRAEAALIALWGKRTLGQ